MKIGVRYEMSFNLYGKTSADRRSVCIADATERLRAFLQEHLADSEKDVTVCIDVKVDAQ